LRRTIRSQIEKLIRLTSLPHIPVSKALGPSTYTVARRRLQTDTFEGLELLVSVETYRPSAIRTSGLNSRKLTITAADYNSSLLMLYRAKAIQISISKCFRDNAAYGFLCERCQITNVGLGLARDGNTEYNDERVVGG
jgi:hypothetical protein